MSSNLKVNKISPATGNNITLGKSGDTMIVPKGAVLKPRNNFILPQNTSIRRRGKNMIYNGDMRYYHGIPITENGPYNLIDPFFNGMGVDYPTTGGELGNGTWTIDQSLDAPEGFDYSCKYTTVTPIDGTSPNFYYSWTIGPEQFAFPEIESGTPNAKGWTLSFWVKCSKTGTAPMQIYNYASHGDEDLFRSITINQADTWEKKSIYIPPLNTPGLQNYWDWGWGMEIYYYWMDDWSGVDSPVISTNTRGYNLYHGDQSYTNTQDIGTTAGATFLITGLQIEYGDEATEFEYTDYGTTIENCHNMPYRVITSDNDDWGYAIQGYFDTTTTLKCTWYHPSEISHTQYFWAHDSDTVNDFIIEPYGYTPTAITIIGSYTNDSTRYVEFAVTSPTPRTVGEAGALVLKNNKWLALEGHWWF